MMPVNAPTSSGMPEADLLGHVIDRHGAGDYAADLLAEAQVDDSWIEQKFPTVFNSQVAHNLKKSVYAIGQGSDRWFSGGSGLSVGQASTILDYLVLVELLLQYRQDLANYQQDLHDCRDQLRMQLRRYTEDKPRHNVPLVDRLVAELARRIGVA